MSAKRKQTKEEAEQAAFEKFKAKSSAKHTHEFKIGKSKKVQICACGKFEHINLKPEDVIVGIDAKHTPGPWKVGNRAVIYTEDLRTLVADCEGLEEKDAAVEMANARLIAAAPELLEACKRAIEALYNVPVVGEEYDQQHSDTHLNAVIYLKEAIAKAEGRS